ncbi:RNA 2',3'-cyclic phosphodiesterase [Tsuneonella sp. YG55]|uniref:RNA 2',3'-cyclic phosphodiesterase n=1 Tax=Tsuneonella litorea TaxID=2976475 RepID=A0A9X3A856_9SPHN|nr:RNA 2',3'-cyclic phosphodiesterase [Tsuneonella litorea]MCT2559096.1 RNA 2',3'-cyclic phosphodiesterase [Tsuneonella litorea]
MTRLFVALRPPPPVRAALLAAQGGVERARWQSDEQLHLTLRFVGEVDRRTAEDLVTALDGVSAPSFTLEVRGVGHFEKKGRASALWAAVAPNPALEVLERRVERACRAAGIAPETRRFIPHVTLARLGGGAVGAGDWLSANGSLVAPAWPVAAFRLYESRMGRGGSAYLPLAEWTLDPANG